MNKKNLNSLVLTFVAALALGATTPAHAQAIGAPQEAPMPSVAMGMAAKTNVFKGAEVNGGFVTLKGRTLKLSPDFKIPKAPAPTWQVVDKEGNIYTLRQLNIVGGKTNRSVEIPAYVKSIAKIRIWCSFAEVNLGEASFENALDLP